MSKGSFIYSDTRKWGDWFYTDLLERNDVPFHYDGSTLTFPSVEAEERASSIWYNLTGMRTIGVFADK